MLNISFRGGRGRTYDACGCIECNVAQFILLAQDSIPETWVFPGTFLAFVTFLDFAMAKKNTHTDFQFKVLPVVLGIALFVAHDNFQLYSK